MTFNLLQAPSARHSTKIITLHLLSFIKTTAMIVSRFVFNSVLTVLVTLGHLSTEAQKVEEIISSLPMRNIGPAFMTGRIADVVKDHSDPSTWYVATASSNVWKTKNNGTTWTPVFDRYPSYSTGCLAMDPGNANVLWLGTGENQSQRSVGWGDGIYRSLDAGKTWKQMGLTQSEHIGKIFIDPRNTDVLVVAAQGPLWKEGGERGVYRTQDGGDTWENVLHISEHTGASDLAWHPSNPDVLYASTYQRRRHVGILVAGGPESRVYKSTDNGKTWKQLQRGLPGGDLGRIALAVSPQRPGVVYAHISGAEKTSGFYRSDDFGESWRKTNDYAIVDPQYYGEIYCDPHRYDHVYVMDVVIHHTSDGGQTFDRLNTRFKHVDNHSLLFDNADPEYLLVGCDGGLYESWDRGDTWKYHDNLPITQFYRVGLDNDFPFYHVYGGTQDNSTLYAPSGTIERHGITNAHWQLALGGDGFQARIDPEDPNTVYCQSQYAGIVRYDRTTGQRTELQPQVSYEEAPLRWHWDSPLIISPHSSHRLYFAAQKLFRSDDRGDSWVAVSNDLSRGEDRNLRKVMGKVWPPEAVWKNVFTSPYGTIVSLSESTLEEGLIVVGTDDGQVQITENGGQSWRLVNSFPGVPDKAYVADIVMSQHERNRIYAVFNNHKEGDFNPYILRSDDLGVSWTSIIYGIEQPHTCWTLVEDHGHPNLLFAGTEFGLFATVDGGRQWHRMKGGLPTIPVRDLEIQQRENDLVCATFGRGMWILDDYTVLRHLASGQGENTTLFPVKDSWSYFEKGNKGYSTKGVFGDNFYSASGTPKGPVLNIHLSENLNTLKEKRKEIENQGDAPYPSYEVLKEEDFESPPEVFALISDDEGNVVARTNVKNAKGFQRVEARLTGSEYSEDGSQKTSLHPVLSGVFLAQVFASRSGEVVALSEARPFEIRRMPLSGEEPSGDYQAFSKAVSKLWVKLLTLREKLDKALKTSETEIEKAVETGSYDQVGVLESKRRALLEIQYDLEGDQTRIRRFQYHHPGLLQRVRRIYNNMWSGHQITETHRSSYESAMITYAELTKRVDALD